MADAPAALIACRLPWYGFLPLAAADDPPPLVNLRVFQWLATLGVGAAFTRALCYAGVPYDCALDVPFMFAVDITAELVIKGTIIWYMARVDTVDALSRRYFYVLFLAMIAAFGLLGNVFPGLYLESRKTFEPRDQAFLFAMVGVIGVMTAWHVVLAWRIDRRYCAVYTASITGLVVYFVLKQYFAFYHLHHDFLFWIVSWFCRHRHPVSRVCLALSTGAFVQGLVVYGGSYT